MTFNGGGHRSSGNGRGIRETLNPVGSSSSYSLHHHPPMNLSMLLPPPPPFQPQLLSPKASVMGDGLAFDDEEFPRRDERVVLWGVKETRDFIAIRAELDGEFAVAKRNKALWELVAERMKDLGYRKTPEQCKCKWKNLVNRYKGKETYDLEEDQQFPFFDELHAVFTAKANHMQPSQINPEGGSMQSSEQTRKVNGDESAEELLGDDDGDDQTDDDRVSKNRIAKKRKIEKGKQPEMAPSGKSPSPPQTANIWNSGSVLGGIPEMLWSFFQQQESIEMQWRESMERYARERELFEHEWRQTMERLERERIMMEQAWREREEQRKEREESRAEKRDALLTALLNKLIQDKDL